MNDYIEVDYITLDDGKKYIVTDKITIGNDTYLYLNNEKDYSDFCIKKIIPDNDEELGGIESKDEFDKALNAFLDKNKNILKEE